jgi:hypothetical protein
MSLVEKQVKYRHRRNWNHRLRPAKRRQPFRSIVTLSIVLESATDDKRAKTQEGWKEKALVFEVKSGQGAELDAGTYNVDQPLPAGRVPLRILVYHRT